MKRLLTTLLFLSINILAFAQQDKAGSTDSELISRYPDSWIIEYSNNEYDQYIIALSKERGNVPGKIYSLKDHQIIEGKRTSIDYQASDGSSQLLIHKNYENALKEKGYKILFSCFRNECDADGYSVVTQLSEGKYIPEISRSNAYLGANASYLVAEKELNGQKTTVAVMSGYNERSQSDGLVYRIDIIQSESMDLSKITVDDIASKMKTDGKMAVYGIQFDFNSAAIRPESQETLTTIAAYLKNNPEINVFVVGHTDNVGNLESNLTLSQNRAESVARELINKYKISTSRVTAKGVAMLSPVSTNSTEQGRTLNRRVEIVKK